MRAWIAARLAQTVLVVFLSLTAVFGMVRLSGDPVSLMLPIEAPKSAIDELRRNLGLDLPIWERREGIRTAPA